MAGPVGEVLLERPTLLPVTDDPTDPSPQNSSHRSWWIAGGVLALAVVVAGLLLFEPWTLFIDREVDEEFPELSQSPTTAPTPSDPDQGNEPTDQQIDGPSPVPSTTEVPSGPVLVARGGFDGIEHPTSGTAFIATLPDGSAVLRFEDLATDNGPDLKVYLSEEPAGGDASAYAERGLDLGGLKGNLGNQNYDIPAGTDLSRYRSAVIWCERFSVGFGVAPLDAV